MAQGGAGGGRGAAGGAAGGAGAEAGAIYAAGGVWARAVERQRTEARRPGGSGGGGGGPAGWRPDAFVFFTGGRGAGKTALLQRLLHPGRTERPRPTEGLEYSFMRKNSPTDLERKDVAHVWEVSGAAGLAEEVLRREALFLHARQVASATVVVALDLSRPWDVLDEALRWVRAVRERCRAAYAQLRQRGSKLPDQLRQRAAKAYGAQHEDLAAVGPYLSGVSVVLVATHWDAFRDRDAELRKVMARTLRFVAHTHGCHLCYVACPGDGEAVPAPGGGAGAAGAAERQAMVAFRALVSSLAFAGPERVTLPRGGAQMDHAGPLLVPSGSDRLRDIGRPRGVEGGTVEDGLRAWREVFENVFPRPPGSAVPGAEPQAQRARMDLSPYPEAAVDAAAARKEEEMAEAHRQQQAQAEAHRRLQAQRLARAQQRAGGSGPAPAAAAAAAGGR